MTTVLIGIWLGFLWLLVKLKILKGWSLWMKLSPIVIWVLATLIIMVPLNWTAPAGPAAVTVVSVKVVPSVSGYVTEVLAKTWTPMKKGEVLFRVDPTEYQAKVRQAEAQLKQARDELARKEKLFKTNVTSQAELDALTAEVEAFEAALTIARQDLEETDVKAPVDGIVPALTLLPGNRVSPNAPVMAFLLIDHPIYNVVLRQDQLRNVKSGQKAEAVFKAYPGKTFSGTVFKVYPSHPKAELELSGSTPPPPEIMDATYVVVLDLDLAGLSLPPGASGQAAVYTDQSPATHIIRQIMLRTKTWLNYLI
ncbi:MAG: efflux RND transporter periplasmic adaptor subunit [Rhizobiaceae bacterium]